MDEALLIKKITSNSKAYDITSREPIFKHSHNFEIILKKLE